MWRLLADADLVAQARAFALEHVVPAGDAIDADDVYPTALVKEVAARGWTSLTLPTRYGGADGSAVDLLAVFEELSVGSAALGVSLITIFQTQKIIELFGPESLKERMLPLYAKGLTASYALTETAHGSDITHLDTKARRDGDEWVITGEKAFITSGSAAELFVVLAETEVGVSAFAIPVETPGVSTYDSPDAETFGLRNGPHVNLVLNEVRVPGDHLIGEEGRGLKCAMVTLANSRTMAAGISLGIARAAFEGALESAYGRKAFGSTVLEFQGIQWYFAEHLTSIDAARLLTYAAARDLDEGSDIARSTSEAKLAATEAATAVAAMAVQVCGAHGTRVNAPFSRYLRDAKTYEVAGGSKEMLKNTIGKSLTTAMAGR
jgi:alkylation response protein AidB-like acyl-CoA dehydrogenase